ALRGQAAERYIVGRLAVDLCDDIVERNCSDSAGLPESTRVADGLAIHLPDRQPAEVPSSGRSNPAPGFKCMPPAVVNVSPKSLIYMGFQLLGYFRGQHFDLEGINHRR